MDVLNSLSCVRICYCDTIHVRCLSNDCAPHIETRAGPATLITRRALRKMHAAKSPAVRPVASISRSSWHSFLQESAAMLFSIRVFCQHNAADTSFVHWMLHLHHYQDVFSLAQPSTTCISFPADHSHHTFTPGKRGVRDQDSCSR